jgi:DNA repair photolyase
MIISASRRTDIPAFYGAWFLERIRAGRVMVKNPFNPNQKKLVSLRPEEVEVIVFWTRNANPLLPYLHELDERGYRYMFLYTITGYGPPLETRSPSLEKALETFRRLSAALGPERVFWRFDPILVVEGNGVQDITSRFARIASSLQNHTSRVIVSFLDFYGKVVKNLQQLENTFGMKVIDLSEQTEKVAAIATSLASLARENRMQIQSCAEKFDLESYGITAGSCIDAESLNRTFGLALKAGKDKSQRAQCRCTVSQDIGTYGTCRHGCVYCYATQDVKRYT